MDILKLGSGGLLYGCQRSKSHIYPPSSCGVVTFLAALLSYIPVIPGFLESVRIQMRTSHYTYVEIHRSHATFGIPRPSLDPLTRSCRSRVHALMVT